MPWSYEHLNWLTDTDQTITTVCGKQAKVYHFEYDITDHSTMKKWAKHFRNHYCSDAEIAILKAPHQDTSEYLINMKFPSRSIAPGPSIRAGDFAEILVADYLERFKKFDVPRTRYDRKAVPNESTKGSDVIAFKLAPDNSDNDELLVFEVKAKLTGKSKDMLQEAIDHSAKDELRLAESLNGMKQRLWDRKELKKVELVTRFQNPVDQPYRQTYGAAAVCSSSVFDPSVLSGADSSKHPHHQDLELITFHGEELMELVHALYELAANEI
ncbi:Hachiman antiphage defense system protein HamA [Vibrio owensii]|uniref:Hachiman antiphage defense system protein HamA n=1 Tax=Vibrio owensii TaxID=696485 RepID=UPI0022DD09F0|nr:Hachiman antiphage defense system protein HamA [Vibrio owensii]MDA0382938.1 SAVED domain-containing protein [Vibrio owensii]